MTTLAFTTKTIAAARLGAGSPLPPFAGHEVHDLSPEGVPDALRAGIAEGIRGHVLPYSTQDDYDRSVAPTEFPVLVLENEWLRATILPTLGGRLWSLYDLRDDVELLYQPPAIQFANLGLRNAWFAGGVEWNIGTIGHSPHTCSPVFSGSIDDDAGYPVVRLWEFERLRGVNYSVEFALPPDSRALFVHVRIDNPNPQPSSMYWWSNTAVPIGDRTRVLSPSTRTYRFDYRSLGEADWPIIDGQDRSYPGAADEPMDYFLRPDGSEQPWIAAIDEEGRGLFQTSTSRLRGRKLFQWGRGRSGRNWQEFLSGPGHEYAEIQAGLDATQLEHLSMPAGAQWSWTEAYGPVNVTAARGHSALASEAAESALHAIREIVPALLLDAAHRAAEGRARTTPGPTFTRGSGWGQVHALLQGPPASTQTVIADADAEEAMHLALLGLRDAPAWSATDIHSVPFAPAAAWAPVLESALADPASAVPRWWVHLQLGAVELNRANPGAAREQWELSIAAAANPWALRSLARLDLREGDLAASGERYAAACALVPDLEPLRLEAADVLIDGGRHDDAAELLLPVLGSAVYRARARILHARVERARGNRSAVRELLDSDFVLTDVREGETVLGELWTWSHEGEPVPQRLDFSLTDEALPRA